MREPNDRCAYLARLEQLTGRSGSALLDLLQIETPVPETCVSDCAVALDDVPASGLRAAARLLERKNR